MLPQFSFDMFPIDGHTFETPDGRVIARVINSPDASPDHGGFTDQRPFMLEFSGGRALTFVLSDFSLHHDNDGSYKKRAFAVVEQWLRVGGPEKIGMFE